MSSEEITKEGRRSPRLVARIPLDVQPIQEPCTTAVINLHGALILSPVPWPSGTALNIQNQKNRPLHSSAGDLDWARGAFGVVQARCGIRRRGIWILGGRL